MNSLIETLAESKGKRLLADPIKSGYIKSFAVFTAFNPDSVQTTDRNTSYDTESIEDIIFNLENELKIGYWYYYKVKDESGNGENSIIVYNITFSDTKELSDKSHLQSFIYGTNENGKFTFAFYSNKSKSKHDYIIIYEKDSFSILDKEADNYYMQIVNDLKFDIPFDVLIIAAGQTIEEMDKRKEQIKWSENDIAECVKNSLDEKKNKKSHYQCRATLKKKY